METEKKNGTNSENTESTYTYSALTREERREVTSIRSKYLPHEESDLERLKRLDEKVKNIPTAISLIVGIVGILIFGLGMACFLEWGMKVLGVIISVVGVVPMSLSYPLYKKIHGKMVKKYGDKILKLADKVLEKE